MTFNPFLDLGDVFLSVLKIFAHIVGLAAGDEAGAWGSAGLLVNGPAAVLDSGRYVIGATVCFGILEI